MSRAAAAPIMAVSWWRAIFPIFPPNALRHGAWKFFPGAKIELVHWLIMSLNEAWLKSERRRGFLKMLSANAEKGIAWIHAGMKNCRRAMRLEFNPTR